jgi:hypothetical protein
MIISYFGGDDTENSKRQRIQRLTCTKAAEEKDLMQAVSKKRGHYKGFPHFCAVASGLYIGWERVNSVYICC